MRARASATSNERVAPSILRFFDSSILGQDQLQGFRPATCRRNSLGQLSRAGSRGRRKANKSPDCVRTHQTLDAKQSGMGGRRLTCRRSRRTARRVAEVPQPRGEYSTQIWVVVLHAVSFGRLSVLTFFAFADAQAGITRGENLVFGRLFEKHYWTICPVACPPRRRPH